MFEGVHGALVHDGFAVRRFHSDIEGGNRYVVEVILTRYVHPPVQKEMIDLEARDFFHVLCYNFSTMFIRRLKAFSG